MHLKYLKPEIAAQLPKHQHLRRDKKGNIFVTTLSGTEVPLEDLITSEKANGQDN